MAALLAVFRINLAKITARFYPYSCSTLGRWDYNLQLKTWRLPTCRSKVLSQTCSHLLSCRVVKSDLKLYFLEIQIRSIRRLYWNRSKLKSAPPIATSSEYRANGGSFVRLLNSSKVPVVYTDDIPTVGLTALRRYTHSPAPTRQPSKKWKSRKFNNQNWRTSLRYSFKRRREPPTATDSQPPTHNHRVYSKRQSCWEALYLRSRPLSDCKEPARAVNKSVRINF